MNFETWYAQVIQECEAIGARPPLALFAPLFHAYGMTPAECAQFLKARQG